MYRIEPSDSPARRRGWLRIALFVVTAALLWAAGELWSSRRVLLWVGLAAAFLLALCCIGCVYWLQRFVVDTVRTVYLRLAFRAVRITCNTPVNLPDALPAGAARRPIRD